MTNAWKQEEGGASISVTLALPELGGGGHRGWLTSAESTQKALRNEFFRSLTGSVVAFGA